MTAQTPIYGIKYIQQGEPVRNTRQALEDNANTIEAALLAKAVPATGAADLAQLSGRVTKIETRPGRKVTKAGTQAATTGWTVVTWENLATSVAGAGMWAAGFPSRLTATQPGRYRALASLIGANAVMMRLNSGGSISGGTFVAGNNVGTGTTANLSVPADEITLVTGDYLEVFAAANATGVMGTAQGYTAFFSLTKFSD